MPPEFPIGLVVRVHGYQPGPPSSDVNPEEQKEWAMGGRVGRTGCPTPGS
jgi:hypothetical protein